MILRDIKKAAEAAIGYRHCVINLEDFFPLR